MRGLWARRGASPTLATARLRLRAPRRGDRPFAAALLSDPEVRAHLGGPVAAPYAAARQALVGGPGETVWIVEATPRIPLGLISLGPHKDGTDIEVSYQFAPAAWGQGYATEALRVVLDHAAQSAIPRIIAETQTANIRSTALLTRVGMTERARIQRFGATQSIFATSPSKDGPPPSFGQKYPRRRLHAFHPHRRRLCKTKRPTGDAS